LPELDGLIGRYRYSVCPRPTVSCVYLVVELSKEVTVDQVNDTLRSAAQRRHFEREFWVW